jgi:cell wall-associated NlpC family hydrolase
LWLAAFVLASAISGCSHTGRDRGGAHISSSDPGEEDLARYVAKLVRPWIGAPYKRGGTSLHGTDCSGFTKAVLSQGFGVELPRRSRDQALVGESVTIDQLRPGDLVFFDLRADRYGIDHVGLYTGGGLFAHARPRSGVVYDRLAEPTYMRGYRGARRVL